jgi:MFS family permease
VSRDDRRPWLVLACWFVAVEGVGFQIHGALLPAFGRQFGVGTSALGLVAPAGTVGFIAALVLTGAVAGRLDAERTLFASAALVALSMLALGLAPSCVAFLGALFVRGALTGVFRGLDRPVLSHPFPDRRGRVLTSMTSPGRSGPFWVRSSSSLRSRSVRGGSRTSC